jgi:hypothetical protein
MMVKVPLNSGFILLIEDIPTPYKSEYLQNGSEFNKKSSAL